MIKGRPCLLIFDKNDRLEEAELLEFDDTVDAIYAKDCWEGFLDD